MATFTLAREICEEILIYPVLVSQFANQSEQRRLITEKQVVGFAISSPACTKASYQAYRAFYTARKGETDGFTFVSPFDDVSYTVRFDGEIKSVFKLGHYRCSFKFKIINADEA